MPGQVHAEERQRRVRHGVDQAADQVGALRREPQVGAAERDDARVGVGAGQPREAVRPGAGAEHGEAASSSPPAWRSTTRRPPVPSRRAHLDARDARAAVDLAARRPHVVGQRVRDAGEVDDRRRGRVQRRDAGGVRLDLAQPVRVEPAQARGRRSPRRGAASSSSPGSSDSSRRDDHLAAALVGDAARVAVLGQLAHALDAQARLQRAGHVVDAGVGDARVVAGLVVGEPVLALEHDDAAAGVAARQLARDGEAEDPAAHDGDVRLGILGDER